MFGNGNYKILDQGFRGKAEKPLTYFAVLNWHKLMKHIKWYVDLFHIGKELFGCIDNFGKREVITAPV